MNNPEISVNFTTDMMSQTYFTVGTSVHFSKNFKDDMTYNN